MKEMTYVYMASFQKKSTKLLVDKFVVFRQDFEIFHLFSSRSLLP